MQFSPPIWGGGGETYTSIDSTFNIRFSPRFAAPFDHPRFVRPFSRKEENRFRWLASMIDGQKRCPFLSATIYLRRNVRSSLVAVFLPSPFRIASTISLKKKKASFVVRRTSRWYTEERWFIERESNVDKELDGTSMTGMEGRSKEEKNGDTILADPRSVNRTIHRANCKSRISGDWS